MRCVLSSAREAAAVKRLAKTLGIPHRTLVWKGKKPATGLQQAARKARYALLAEAAHRSRRLLHPHRAHARRSGRNGADPHEPRQRAFRPCGHGAGVAAAERAEKNMTLVRPLLDMPKARLIATLACGQDRLCRRPLQPRSALYPRASARPLCQASPARASMPPGCRFWRAASSGRIRRLKPTPTVPWRSLPKTLPRPARSCFPATKFARLPAEIALRLIGRAVTRLGDEGPVELGKLEALHAALAAAQSGQGRFRRSLAGAIVTFGGGQISVEKAPPRRQKSLTTRQAGKAKRRRER